MIPRQLESRLRQAARHYPVVTLTGPRQAGKTTLVRAVFDDLPYVNLEPLDVREEVREDPRGFLRDHRDGAVVDEAHHAPELFSYLQEAVDEDPTPGRFVLTGSQHLGLADAVSQTLAGRTAVLQLYPLSWVELQQLPSPPADLWTVVWSGGFPRIWDRGIPAGDWLRDYTATYVERDVRRVQQIADLRTFRAFLELLAGRTGQEENLNGLAGDVGVARSTVASWMSVLEATFVAWRLPAWSANVRKRVVKAAKTHLSDSGLVCHLLGIADPDQLRRHPLRGQVFETWVACEVDRMRVTRVPQARLAHYRETRGVEVDLVVSQGDLLRMVEIKSGATTAGDWFDNLAMVGQRFPDAERAVVYGGDRATTRRGVHVLPWSQVDRLLD